MIIGVGGLVGTRLKSKFTAEGFNVVGLSLRIMERDPKLLVKLRTLLAQQNIDVMINCAAMLGMKQCYHSPDLADIVNAWMPGELARLARETGVIFAHLSTEAVFPSNSDGRIYSASDEPMPETEYGKTKYRGELNVINEGGHTIIRLPRVFDFERQIVPTLFEIMKKNGTVRVAHDLFSTPIFSGCVATGTFSIINEKIQRKNQKDCQIIHVSGRQRVSLFQLVSMLARESERERIIPVDSSYFITEGIEPPFLNGGLKACYSQSYDLMDGIRKFHKAMEIVQ